MPRTVVYRAGGFTNCGIGYTKLSQEELAERRDRAMTENEALEALKLEGGLEITGRPIRVAQFFEGRDMAIKALEEIQQYRAIGTPEECRAAVEKQKEMITYCDENDCSDCPFHNTSKKYNKCMNDFIAEEIVKGGGVDGN